MRGYLAKSDRQTSGSVEHGAEGHVARTDATAPSANGASQTGASLTQLQRALDRSPAIQSQIALQRALDQRATGAKAPQKKKPALQKKGIAINDDAGLEREADVMGARASGWAAAIQRAPKAMPSATKSSQKGSAATPSTITSTPPSTAGSNASKTAATTPTRITAPPGTAGGKDTKRATVTSPGAPTTTAPSLTEEERNEAWKKIKLKEVWKGKKEQEMHEFVAEKGAPILKSQPLTATELERLSVAVGEVIKVRTEIGALYELLDEIDWGYHSERIENLTTLRNEITGLLTPRSDTRVKLYIRDKHIDLKAVNYENVSAYCANKGNDHPNRINLAKAWNNSGGREDKQFIDTNAIHNEDKKADTKSSAAPKSSAGGAAGGNVKGKPAPAPKGTAKGVDSSNLAAGAGGNLNPMASSYGQSVPPKKKVPQRARAAGAQAPAKNPLLLRPHH